MIEYLMLLIYGSIMEEVEFKNWFKMINLNGCLWLR